MNFEREHNAFCEFFKVGRYPSGQRGQTVNLLALRLRWFESSSAQFFRLSLLTYTDISLS